jgi:hypothetical protein
LGRITSVLTAAELAKWCRSALGSGVAETQFERGNLSRVLGVTLVDGREVVIKIRRWESRLLGCVAVQRELARAGYPCPAPLSAVDRVGGWAVNAEALVRGGRQREPSLGADAYALLLRRLIAAASTPAEVPTLKPAPPWTAWDHCGAGTWPDRDDRGMNLNLFEGPVWIDSAAAKVRDALSRYTAPLRIGHGDWESQNIRWNGNDPLVVHDWDSVIAQPEAAIVGLASSVWAAQGAPGGAATVAQTEEFIDAYAGTAEGWTVEDSAAAWTAGLWVRLFNAKKDATDGGCPQLDRLADEIDERLRRSLVGN